MHKQALMMGKALALGTSLAFGACSDADDFDGTVEVRSSSTADFRSYHTFAFARPSQSVSMSAAIPSEVQRDLAVIDDAVRQELVEHGLTEVEPSMPHDLVAFSLASTESQQAVTWGCGGGYWWGYWEWEWDPCAWIEPFYVEYEVGTAFVGLIDQSAQAIVFGGVMQGVLADPDDLNDRVEDGVEEMFDAYPEH